MRRIAPRSWRLIFAIMPLLYAFSGICYEAFVAVPVADLLGEPFFSNTTDKNEPRHAHSIKEQYQTIAITTGKNNVCARLHQALFNERVEIINEKDDQVQLLLPSAFYQTPGTTTCQNSYWALKKNFAPIQRSASKESLDTNKLVPPAIDFNKPESVTPATNLITLKNPWYDAITDQTFSVGTRLVVTNKLKTDAGMLYGIIFYDHARKKAHKRLLPAHLCLTPATNKKMQRQRFVALLKNWATKQPSIPYVLGGSSYGGNKKSTANQHALQPTTGFDCSGLILRAAQTCGIPYFFKNSYTIAHNMMEVITIDQLQNGDIIWVPGHVMIVSDIRKNLLIEARGYEHGLGKLCQTNLETVFENNKNYEDLMRAARDRTMIGRLNKGGKPVGVYAPIKFFGLMAL